MIQGNEFATSNPADGKLRSGCTAAFWAASVALPEHEDMLSSMCHAVEEPGRSRATSVSPRL